MNTVITDKSEVCGWVLYDAHCRLCANVVRRCAGVLAHRGLQVLPLQTGWVQRRLGLREDQLLAEMRLLLPDGRVIGGAEAVVEISRRFWWAWPFHVLGRVSAVKPFLRAGYAWLARHRNCANGACKIVRDDHGAALAKARNRRRKEADDANSLRNPPFNEPERQTPSWRVGELRARAEAVLGAPIARVTDVIPNQESWNSPYVGFSPLLLLMGFALSLAHSLPAWGFMWAIAFALFAGCKWLTFWEARRNGVGMRSTRATGYLLAWPGMDAAAFLDAKARPTLPRKIEWLFATGKTLFGSALVWLFAQLAAPIKPLFTGWLGMIGVVFLLHFGLFHLLSLAWRTGGVNAAPIMRSPLLARSLSEFWGKRWNTAFHELVHRFTFRPMARRVGASAATLLVFLLSGLVHELVISLPARGGYGLPTGYFLIQGLGVVGEHTRLGRRLGLGRGRRGWLFTLFVVTAPAFWLFHPQFIERVILPMLHAIGAT